MKVTLINVGDIIAYGLRCISSALKREQGVSTKIVFIPPRFSDISHPELIPSLKRIAEGSVFIGISVMTGQFRSAEFLTKHLREATGIPICWGGVHPTILPEECLQHADFVCLGEAEETVCEIARRLASEQTLEGVRGVYYREGREIVKNPLRPFPEDLDLLPPPDHDFSNHYLFDYGKGALLPMDAEAFMRFRGSRYTTLPTRGCSMNCSYCVNHVLHKLFPGSNRLRRKSVAKLMEELEWVRENLTFVTEINFYDDDFMLLNEEYLEEFARNYAERVGLPLFISGISPANFSAAKLDSIRRHVRLSKLRLGIQSGSERLRRDVYNRHHSNDKLRNIIKYFAGMRKHTQVNYDVILENPWETEQDRIDTFRLLVDIPKPFRLLTYYLTFYPGTALFERAQREGLLNSENRGYDQKYQKPRGNDPINKIIPLMDKLPKWFLFLVLRCRKWPLAFGVLLGCGKACVAARRKLRNWLGSTLKALGHRSTPPRKRPLAADTRSLDNTRARKP